MVKSIWVSDDESLLYTGGSDGTVRLWDMTTRSAIMTYGEQKGQGRRSDSISDLCDDFQFHTDTVTSIIPSCMGDHMTDGQFMMSAGRDGAICEVDVTTSEYLKVHQQKEAITCLAPDLKNGFLWYGTSSSTFNCFKVPSGDQ